MIDRLSSFNRSKFFRCDISSRLILNWLRDSSRSRGLLDEDWVSGDDPMTESQKSYLDTLAKRAGEELPANLTKAEASEHIDRLNGSGA